MSIMMDYSWYKYPCFYIMQKLRFNEVKDFFFQDHRLLVELCFELSSADFKIHALSVTLCVNK